MPEAPIPFPFPRIPDTKDKAQPLQPGKAGGQEDCGLLGAQVRVGTRQPEKHRSTSSSAQPAGSSLSPWPRWGLWVFMHLISIN